MIHTDKTIAGDNGLFHNPKTIKMTGDDQDPGDKTSPPEVDLPVEIDWELDDDSDHEPIPFDELPNIHISRHIDVYRNQEIDSVPRPRGILSKADREYLYGVKDYAHEQSEANRRQDIRDRVKSSIKDFKILWALLNEDDREQIFSSLDQEAVDEYIEAIVTFLYLGLRKDTPRLEKAIKRGILAGETVSSNNSSPGEAKRIDISIDIDYYPDVEDIKKKLEKHPIDELTVEELGVLAKSGELDSKHIDALNDEHIHPPPGYFDYDDPQPTVDKDPMNDDYIESGKD